MEPRTLKVLSLTLLILACVAGPLAAQQGGTIRGRVVSSEGDQPLPGAHIMVEGTVRGAIAGADGGYVIPRLTAGPHTLIFSRMGYETMRRRIQLPEGGTVRVDAALEPSALVMPDVVVTAGRQEQRTVEASAAVAVLAGEAIRSRAVLRLDEVLSLVPGVTMVDNQVGIRGSTGYSRGAGSRALVLLDGIPLLGGDTGNVRWEMLPAQMTERIEVVRGASSSLYGSSAMGGVVNVLTRSPASEPGTWVRLDGGFWQEPYYEAYRREDGPGLRGGVSFVRSLSAGAGGLLLSGGYEDSQGWRQNGWRRQGHLMLKGEGPRDGPGRWEVLALAARSDAGHFIEWRDADDPYQVAAEAEGDWLRFDEYALAFQWEQLTGGGTWFRVVPHLQGVAWDHHFHDSDASSGTVRGGLEAQAVTAGPWGVVTAGLSGGLTMVDASIYEVSRVRQGALFLQNEADLGGDLRLSVGIRRDLHGTDATPWRAVWSPRAALVWQAREELTLRVNSGRGFRAPSVAELFASTATSGFQVVPNPDLVPETAWTWEGGLSWRLPGPVQVDAALFDSRYEEMIEPGLAGGGDIQFRNLRSARIRGAELVLQAPLLVEGTRAGLSLLWLWARDADSGEALTYRRPLEAALTLEGRWGPLRAGLDVRHGRRMDAVTVYPFERRNDLWRVDARLSTEALGMRWTLQSRNLTRYAYTVIERNLSAPREWMVSVERTWDD